MRATTLDSTLHTIARADGVNAHPDVVVFFECLSPGSSHAEFGPEDSIRANNTQLRIERGAELVHRFDRIPEISDSADQ